MSFLFSDDGKCSQSVIHAMAFCSSSVSSLCSTDSLPTEPVRTGKPRAFPLDIQLISRNMRTSHGNPSPFTLLGVQGSWDGVCEVEIKGFDRKPLSGEGTRCDNTCRWGPCHCQIEGRCIEEGRTGSRKVPILYFPHTQNNLFSRGISVTFCCGRS